MRLFKNSKIDFVGKRRAMFLVSALLIVGSVVSLLIKGGPDYGIDFTGGVSMELNLSGDGEKAVTLQQLRDVFAGSTYDNVDFQKLAMQGDKNIFLLSSQIPEGKDTPLVEKEIVQTLKEKLPAYTKSDDLVRSSQTVGPQIGKELKSKALQAIFYALCGIVLYIWWRFKKFTYGFAAVVALAHDVLITVGVFSVLDLKFSLPIVAALLTLVGYSLNDTIVVFARIREDSNKNTRMIFPEIVNFSINETLSRTVITSFTTFMVVLFLYLFGGSVIHDFSFAILIGVVIGTYSSIFVASPILVEGYLRKHKK